MTKDTAVLFELLQLASDFAAMQAHPNSRIYADLGINGGDFLELVETVERRYGVDLDWVSPRDLSAEAQDPTLESLAENIVSQLG